MKPIILLIGLLMIAGCTTTETITEYINTTNTITETLTVKEYINTTVESYCPDATYVSRLDRDYNRCKSELDFWNRTDKIDINYDLNVSLERCRQKVEDLKELI